MAVIRTNVSPKLRGGVGEFSYYTQQGYQFVRPRKNVSNYGESASRTYSQQERRILWGNLMNVYQSLLPWIGDAFRRQLQSKKGLYIVNPANDFVKQNVNNSTVYLTKEQVALGYAVLQSYRISSGVLPSLYQMVATPEDESQQQYMNVVMNLDSNDPASLTIGQFSRELITLNDGRFRDGDSLTYITFFNGLDAALYPRVYSRTYKVTLNMASNVAMNTIPFGICIRGSNGTSLQMNMGNKASQMVGAAMIHSRSVGGVLQLSSQSIALGGWGIDTNYKTPAAKEAAILSYGLSVGNSLTPSI